MSICSDPSVDAGVLVSPPRGWPNSFKQPALKRFLSKTLKGKRVRLVGADGDGEDAAWKLVVGFAVSESEAHKGVYVATPHTWREHPDTGVWTADGAPGSQQVLVESALTAAEAATAVETAKVATTVVPTPTGDEARPMVGPASVIDVSDAAPTQEEPPPPPPAAAAAETGASPDEAPAPEALPPAPPPSEAGSSKKKKAKPPKPTSMGLWRSRDEIRMVAKDADEERKGRRTRKTIFPGRKAQVRVMMHAEGNVFELEARRWGQEFDGLREPMEEGAPRREPEMFTPLEYGDKEAAALHVVGTWSLTQYDEFHIIISSVNELRNGDEEPPITTKQIHYAVGKSLGRPLKMRGSKEHTFLRIELNEYLKHHVLFERGDDRLSEKELAPHGPMGPSLYELPPSAAKPGGTHFQPRGGFK